MDPQQLDPEQLKEKITSAMQPLSQPRPIQKVDVNNLVFKTMPKSGSYAAPKAVPVQAQANTPAPAIAPVQHFDSPSPIMQQPKPIPPAPSKPPMQPLSQPQPIYNPVIAAAAAHSAPMQQPVSVAPAAPAHIPNPAQAVHPAPVPSAINLASHLNIDQTAPAQQQGSKKMIWILTAVLVVAALAAGAFFYLKSRNSTSQNVIPPATTPTTPAVSKIPAEWQTKYFGAAACIPERQNICGDNADPDHDGLSNYLEYKANTDPNNADTDGDGIADGDEVHVFNSDPTTSHTAQVEKFTDAGDIKFKYNSRNHADFTDAELKQIAANIKNYGLHSPTTATLSLDLINFYTNYGGAAGSAGTAQAADRDTQRLSTIKQIGFALLAYKTANKTFPNTSDFAAMISDIQSQLSGKAVNSSDPTNTPPFVYVYQALNSGADFQISYYSEVKNELAIFKSADIQAFYDESQASQRDIQRQTDTSKIAAALQAYSDDNSDPANSALKHYPTQQAWKTALMPKYLAEIPTDPKTGKDYNYTVASDSQSFAVQAILELPPAGQKGYYCSADGCGYY